MHYSQQQLIYASRLLKWLLFGLFGILLLYYLFFSNVLYCQLIGRSDFYALSERLYISPGIPKSQHTRIRGEIDKAVRRNTIFWDTLHAKPVIILCSSPEEYARFCKSSEGAGCSLGTPFRQSYIVVNAFGLNADVISHEMVHTELFARLGWLKTTFTIPQWFNEGLALMLDYRFVNAGDAQIRYEHYRDLYLKMLRTRQDTLRLNEISSVRSFFTNDSKRTMFAYMTSGFEVSHWLMRNDRQGLFRLLEKVRNGDDFIKTYKIIDQRSKSSTDTGLGKLFPDKGRHNIQTCIKTKVVVNNDVCFRT